LTELSLGVQKYENGCKKNMSWIKVSRYGDTTMGRCKAYKNKRIIIIDVGLKYL
jgi:hypothetical protein